MSLRPLPSWATEPTPTVKTVWWLLFAMVAAMALVASGIDVWRHHPSFFDLKVYRLGAAEAVDGTGRLYDFRYHGYSFTYPPIAAALLGPLGLLPVVVVEAGWTVLEIPCLAAIWWLSLRAVRPTHRFPRAVAVPTIVAAVAASAALLEPVLQSFRLGQVNLLLLLMVLVDLVGPKAPRWRGVLTGIAAAIKLTPLVFLGFLLVTRQWQALRNALIAFVGAAAIGFVVLPSESVHYWTDLILNSSRIGPIERGNNQSVMGMLLRLGAPVGGTGTTLAWLVIAGAVSCVALALAAACWRRDERLLAVSLVGIAGLFTSPVSWSHHWVWCIPVGVGLVSLTRSLSGKLLPGCLAAALWCAVFVIAPQRHLPNGNRVELTWTPLQQFIGSTYLWASLLMLGFVAYQLVAHPAPTPCLEEGAGIESEPLPALTPA